ncbi:MAG TPA: hypothetical protein DIW45_07800 [Erythrobacter sp.]|nr:hypothetical protein [Erythrobacter sp.]|tara:strand:+ start:38 stop:505 length:468 start_codon:yes stop_codon:yes gene_type:complete
MSLLPDSLKMLVAGRMIHPERVDGSVYYIACPETLRLKIGYTKGNPVARLRALRTGSPTDIRLMAVHPGSLNDEHTIHGYFAEQRLHGEWFEVDEALFEFMSYVAWSTVAISKYRGTEAPQWAMLGLDSVEDAINAMPVDELAGKLQEVADEHNS